MPAPFPYASTTAEPAECAEQLGAGRAAAGLVPVAALPFLPDRAGAAGARDRRTGGGEVGAADLAGAAGRDPHPGGPRRLAHLGGAGAPAARRALGRATACRAGRPPLEAMLADGEAAVLIGDPALHVHGRSGRPRGGPRRRLGGVDRLAVRLRGVGCGPRGAGGHRRPARGVTGVRPGALGGARPAVGGVARGAVARRPGGTSRKR